MTDVPEPLTEEELNDYLQPGHTPCPDCSAEEGWTGEGDKYDIRHHEGCRRNRLVAEVRRLRKLVIDAEPYVPDNEQTRTMDLPARLKAEVDRE